MTYPTIPFGLRPLGIMGHPRCGLEVAGDGSDDSVISKKGIAIQSMVLQFGDAGRTVAIKSPGTVD
jgi:hypothetical protein